ncbi:hypothetical protein B0H67DRAFT_569160 [Lasiosphaeris hirsuta]|uniref:Extracellular membrane protein CFEM domain-containing protein n=1 Tax=Lasiosphaeris hirsuta TaxID=260670 RepID=A0AA40AZS3_9PEZI|nr:hypothetical protein B0H67DRAFT_569160 [Lasiosphaeris hirsuta]
MYRQLLLLAAPLAALVNGQNVARQPVVTPAAHVAREPVITPAVDIGRRSLDLDAPLTVTPSWSGCSASQTQFGNCAAYDVHECSKDDLSLVEEAPCYCSQQTKLYQCFTSYCPTTGSYYDVVKGAYDGCNGALPTATSGSSSGSGSGSGSSGSSGSGSKPNAAPASRVSFGASLMLWGFWATVGAGAFVAMIVA